jgi:Mce-associated membrane protein
VAGLVAASTLGWQYGQGRRAESARSEALNAARRAAPVVLSYDYRHLDRDFTRARTLLTGHFRDQYGKTTTTVVGPTAKKYHGVVKATVPAASVASASPDKVTVLLFVNQVTQSTQVSGSRLDLNRVRMTMARTSEGWKVSAVDAL